MNRLLNYILIALLAGHMPYGYGMNNKPTITDADDDMFFDAQETTANTAQPHNTTTALTTPAVPRPNHVTAPAGTNNQGGNIKHAVTFVNNQGQQLHVGVDKAVVQETVGGVLTTAGDVASKTITTVLTATEQALTGFEKSADQTMQRVKAGVDQLGGTGAKAITTVSAAGGQAVTDVFGRATAGTQDMANVFVETTGRITTQVTNNLNRLTDEGRASLAEYRTAIQNTVNVAGTNINNAIEIAGQQGSRIAFQARVAAGQATDNMRAAAKELGAGISAAGQGFAEAGQSLGQAGVIIAREAFTEENITAFGSTPAALTLAEKTSTQAGKFIDQGTAFVATGANLIEQTTPHVVNAAKSGAAFMASAEQQAPAITGNFINLLNAATNTLNASANALNATAGAMQGQAPQLIEMAKASIPLITEILDEQALLALPAPKQFEQQTKLLQIAAVAFNTRKISTAEANILKLAFAAQQKKQPINAATLAQLRKLVVEKPKNNQPLLLTNGQEQREDGVTITDRDDDATPSTPQPAPTPIISDAEHTDLMTQLKKVAQPAPAPGTTPQENNGTTPQKSFLRAPHPLTVIVACITGVGLLIVGRKMYIKWKKNKERKEKRKALKNNDKQDAAEAVA